MAFIYTFGDFELHPDARQLLRDGQEMALGGRSFDLLLVLVERSPHLVAHEELMRLVWPGLVVESGNLPVQIWTLRQRLGPRAIGTVARRGYRLMLPVRSRALPEVA